MYRLAILAVLPLALLLGGRTFPADAPVAYARDAKPVLTARCYACHGALQQKGDLRLDTAGLVRKGGLSGAAIVPGKSADSLLLAHVTAADGKPRMPPASEGDGLTAKQIETLRAWID